MVKLTKPENDCYCIVFNAYTDFIPSITKNLAIAIMISPF